MADAQFAGRGYGAGDPVSSITVSYQDGHQETFQVGEGDFGFIRKSVFNNKPKGQPLESWDLVAVHLKMRAPNPPPEEV